MVFFDHMPVCFVPNIGHRVEWCTKQNFALVGTLLMRGIISNTECSKVVLWKMEQCKGEPEFLGKML